MKAMWKSSVMAGALAVAVAAAAPHALAQQPAGATGVPPELREMYDAAAREGGGVRIYSQIVPTTLEVLARQWNQRFPNVRLDYVRLTTAPLIERMNAEFASGRPLADVVMVSDSVWPEDLMRAGRIAEYPLDAYRFWPAQYKRDNHYFVSQLYVSAILYNPRRIAPAEAPRSYTDVLRYGRQASIADPRAGGGNAAIMFGTMRLLGDGFWRQAAAAGVQYSPTVAEAAPRVVSGDVAVSIHTHSLPACLEAQGRPIRTVYPAEGVWSTPAVTFGTRGSARPRAAALFLAYVMSEEGQSFINTADCTYSVRPGVAVSPALPAFNTLNVIDITPDQWRQQGAALRQAAARAAGVPID